MRIKMSKPPSPAPTVSAVGPCPTVIQIVGRSGTGSLPSTIAPPGHPLLLTRATHLTQNLLHSKFFLHALLHHPIPLHPKCQKLKLPSEDTKFVSTRNLVHTVTFQNVTCTHKTFFFFFFFFFFFLWKIGINF